ncbi:hypothetical protein QC764_0079380 [Podospora pseudoanserina]|uniref:Uncharacterized protein n=1 Tax=Podospora pseudoanserina TaxID=2609844 RepID=A0ABR0I5D0_9PEZI|nr:hypothetical protein QC764_0079380 [Podospora pseudoanserina]
MMASHFCSELPVIFGVGHVALVGREPLVCFVTLPALQIRQAHWPRKQGVIMDDNEAECTKNKALLLTFN